MYFLIDEYIKVKLVMISFIQLNAALMSLKIANRLVREIQVNIGESVSSKKYISHSF